MEHEGIYYSVKYYDGKYEYRHCELKHEELLYAITQFCKDQTTKVPEQFMPLAQANLSGTTLTESQWRSFGIQMSMGWQHYIMYRPNPTVLCFRRPKGINSQTGLAPKGWTPYEGEENIWAIELFEPGDLIWVKDQLAQTLYTTAADESDAIELCERMRLIVTAVDEYDNIQVRSQDWDQDAWISKEYLHCLTKISSTIPDGDMELSDAERLIIESVEKASLSSQIVEVECQEDEASQETIEPSPKSQKNRKRKREIDNTCTAQKQDKPRKFGKLLEQKRKALKLGKNTTMDALA